MNFATFFGHFITTILVLCYCFSMSSTNAESAEAKREKRLQRRRERERAHRASETAEQREQRLSRRRIRDRARREAQSVEQRQTLLQRRRERLNRHCTALTLVLQFQGHKKGKSLCAGRHNEVQSKRRRTTEVLLKQLRLAPHHALHVTSYY